MRILNILVLTVVAWASTAGTQDIKSACLYPGSNDDAGCDNIHSMWIIVDHVYTSVHCSKNETEAQRNETVVTDPAVLMNVMKCFSARASSKCADSEICSLKSKNLRLEYHCFKGLNLTYLGRPDNCGTNCGNEAYISTHGYPDAFHNQTLKYSAYNIFTSESGNVDFITHDNRLNGSQRLDLEVNGTIIRTWSSSNLDNASYILESAPTTLYIPLGTAVTIKWHSNETQPVGQLLISIKGENKTNLISLNMTSQFDLTTSKTSTSSIGVPTLTSYTNTSSTGVSTVTSNTNTSSIGLSTATSNTNTSSIGLSTATSYTSTSSTGVSTATSYTSTSSTGVSTVTSNTTDGTCSWLICILLPILLVLLIVIIAAVVIYRYKKRKSSVCPADRDVEEQAAPANQRFTGGPGGADVTNGSVVKSDFAMTSSLPPITMTTHGGLVNNPEQTDDVSEVKKKKKKKKKRSQIEPMGDFGEARNDVEDGNEADEERKKKKKKKKKKRKNHGEDDVLALFDQ